MHTNTPSDVLEVETIAHTHVKDCYQCGKCSAGCPMAEQMDAMPSTLIRLVQIDRVNEAAEKAAVWQCVSCLTCSARCPKSVHIAGVMDALKQLSVKRKLIHPKYKRVVAFQKAFLDIIYKNGRTNELELTAMFKMYGFFSDFNVLLAMKDSKFAIPMLFKKKLHLKLGGPLKNKALVRRIFQKCEDKK